MMRIVQTIIFMMCLVTVAHAQERDLCAAVRGNGVRMFAHFTALARTHEIMGPLDAISGGSSGSIVSYVTDAIYSNPLVRDCGGRLCSREESNARRSLLYKSVESTIAFATRAKGGYSAILPSAILSVLDKEQIDDLLRTDPNRAVAAFLATVDRPEFKSDVNPTVVAAITAAPNKSAMVADILKGIRGTNDFVLDSPSVFVRPGILNFNVLADIYGHVGSFLAQDGPHAKPRDMAAFLSYCAVPGMGLSWQEISTKPAANGTCGSAFEVMATDYFSHINQPADWLFIDRTVGSALPVLVSVSAMMGKSAELLRAAKQEYGSNLPIRWMPDFADWRVLYTGRHADLARMLENRRAFDDLKTRRAAAMPNMTWRDIMIRSGSEPGTQSAIDLGDYGFTAGGWVDGQPVRPLLNIGCKRVILFETVPSQSYQSDVARLLGAQQSDIEALFDTDRRSSSYSLNFDDASAVWCSDWNSVPAAQFTAVSQLGWNGHVEIRSKTAIQNPYSNVTRTPNSTICTPERKH